MADLRQEIKTQEKRGFVYTAYSLRISWWIDKAEKEANEGNFKDALNDIDQIFSGDKIIRQQMIVTPIPDIILASLTLLRNSWADMESL